MDFINNVICLYIDNAAPCTFIAIPKSDCPCSEVDDSGCNRWNLPECSNNLDDDAFCEADSELPDGSMNYDIDNCPGGYDVFKCSRGKNKSFP